MTKWKLVPIEPTPEMIWKAEEDSPEFHHGDPWYGSEPPSEGQIRAIYTAMLEAAQQPEPLSDKRLFHYAAEIRKALGPDPIGATLNIVALLRAIEREILGGGHE